MKKKQIIQNAKEAQIECFEMILQNAISDNPSEILSQEMMYTHFMLGLDIFLLTSLN